MFMFQTGFCCGYRSSPSAITSLAGAKSLEYKDQLTTYNPVIVVSRCCLGSGQCATASLALAVITFVGGSGAIGSHCHSGTRLVGLICRTAVPLERLYGVLAVAACAHMYCDNSADLASTLQYILFRGTGVCSPASGHACEFSFQALHKCLDKPLLIWHHRGVRLTNDQIELSSTATSIIEWLSNTWHPCFYVLCGMV